MVNSIILLIIIVFIISFSTKKNILPVNNFSPTYSLLKLVKSGKFSNVKIVTKSNGIFIITANFLGDNYLFAAKNNSKFSIYDIETINTISQNSHIHNVIIITPSLISSSTPVGQKIIDLGFENWNTEKLKSILNNNINNNPIKTDSQSNVTDYIANEPEDNPIQHGKSNSHSLIGSIFRKPNRL